MRAFLRGCGCYILICLCCSGDLRMLNVEKDRWHSLECLESGSVLYESKDGPYHPLEEDEIMVK